MSHPIDEHVAIFWDYENCAPPTSVPGYDVVNNIRQVAHEYGIVKLFKAYLELSEQSSSKSIGLRSELQSCGVSLTDCPHNGRKDVADKMMIVDMLTYAIDNPAPATIVLISGDRDFVYAVSVLRLRKYRVVLVAPTCAHASLKSQASAVLNWETDIMGKTSPRPQTLDASHNPSDDPLQRSPRRPSFGSQLPPPTPKHGRRPSFKTNTPITPITPDDVNTSGNSFFDGRHQRNPSIVTTDECFPLDIPTPGCHIPQLRDIMDPIPTQPPIPDLVDFMHDLKGLRPPSPARRPPSNVPSGQCTSAIPMPSVNSPVPTSPSDVAHSETTMETNSPGQDPSFNGIIEPASAPPHRVNTGPIIAPEPISFPRLAFENQIIRPATVEPLSRVPSDRSQSSVAASTSTSGSASSSSSEDPFYTPNSSEAIDITPPTSALDVEESPIADAAHPLPPLSKDNLLPGSPSPTPAGTVPDATAAPLADIPVAAEDALPSIPRYFHPLVKALEESRLRGALQPLRSWVGLRIPPGTYAEAKVSTFKQYTTAAEKAGIVELGGLQSKAWISLRPEWHGRLPVRLSPSS